jgi:hypothetical protein
MGTNTELSVRTQSASLLFNKEKLKERAAFGELLSIDFFLDQLSTQRHAAKFDWINQTEENDLAQAHAVHSYS